MARNRPSRWIMPLIAALAVAMPAAVAVSYLADLATRDEFAGVATTQNPMDSTPFIVPGIRTPKTVAAATAELSDEEPVIGVSHAGRHRAYRIAALSTMSAHVVNDLIEQSPVTVTYCDRTDCCRVLTGDSPGEPLEVETGGFHHGLMLKYGNRFFSQSASEFVDPAGGTIPLSDFPFVRTTWGKWRESHPDTDVFVERTERP